MGFLPKIRDIVTKIINILLSSKILAGFISLFFPGQLIARQVHLNSYFVQHLWLYLPMFWFPPFSIIHLFMIWKKKFTKFKQPSAKIYFLYSFLDLKKGDF